MCITLPIDILIYVFRLEQLPQTLAELGESLKLLESLQRDLAKTEAQIRLIHEQFAILDKYEVPVEQAVRMSIIKNTQMHMKLCRPYIYRY